MKEIRVGTAGLALAILLYAETRECRIIDYGDYYTPARIEIPAVDVETFGELHKEALEMVKRHVPA